MIPIERTRKVILCLTRQGRQAIGAAQTGASPESIAHEYWKRHYARLLEAEGHRVAIEAPRAGGRVDVLAVKDGVRTAVEIETGKSDAVGNVRSCLRSGFERIIVVATSSEAFAKVQAGLAGAGLFGTSQVLVVTPWAMQ